MTTSTSPLRMPARHLAGLGAGEEPGQHLDAHRVAGEAVAEGLVVLLGEQRRRDEHGHLLAVLHRLERGPDGDLGLAEADVAAHEAVHRVVGLHVALHLDDGGELVGRLLVREGLLQLALPRRVLGEGVAGGVEALLVEHHQLLGDLGDDRAHLGLGLLPAVTAEPVQRRGVAAGVVAHRVDLVGRHVELVVALVLEQQVVALHAADGPLDHAGVAGDAVLVVHDVVARLQVVEEPLRVAAGPPGGAVGTAATGEVVLGDHGQLDGGQDAAALQRADVDGRRDAVAGQQRPHPRGRALAVGGHDDLVPVAGQLGELAHDALGVAGGDRDPHRGDGGDVGPLGGGGDGPGRRVGVGQQPVEGEVQAREAVVLPRRGGAPRLGEGGGQVGLLGQQVGGPVAHAAGLEQEHQRVRPDEVEQHVLALGEPRQPALHPVEGLPLGQALPLLAAPRLEGDEPLGPLLHLGGGEELAAPEDLDPGQVVGGALVADGELGEAVDLVAPEVDAHRPVGRGGVDVDDRAAHGQLPAVLDHLFAAVAGGDELAHQLVPVALLAGDHHHGLHVLDVGPEPLDERPHGGDQHAAAPAPGSRRRHIVRRRRPMVSTDGDTRSKGSVSQAGKASTASAPR